MLGQSTIKHYKMKKVIFYDLISSQNQGMLFQQELKES
jgi:hypothetical protein